MSWQTRVPLIPEQFGPLERIVAEHGELRASASRFASGVEALQLDNGRGQLVMLPFQGQQIWRLTFDGRPLTMRSMFEEPRATSEFLHTYGGFLQHCGATAMGTPGPGDSHPTHGELPNARYQLAELLIGEDAGGSYLGLSGRYQHTVAFNHNYLAQPTVKLYLGASSVQVGMRIRNLKRSPMELMYLAHVNFRPVDHARLHDSALDGPSHVRVRRSVPGHIHPSEGYSAFLDELADHPERHRRLDPALQFDPEVVFFIDLLADEDGWAHSLQRHPDGSADFISHRPGELEHGIRWISRTPDQDCLGLLLPATAEPEGYLAEKAKGHLRQLPPGGEFTCNYRFGSLTPDEAEGMAQAIDRIRASAA